MLELKRSLLVCISLMASALSLPAQTNNAAPITNGQRVFTCGHSFHFWVPPLLKELANAAGITNHVVAGVS